MLAPVAGASLAVLVGAGLLFAAGLKVVDREHVAVGAGTFGLHGRAAGWIWLPLAALEALLAAGLLAGWRPAAWAATAALCGFAAAQAIAIAAGRAGAPCGCFGARGRISWGSVARTASLGAGTALLGLAAIVVPGGLRAGAAAVAVVLAAGLVARAHRSGSPAGALDVASEGPPLGTRLELAGPATGDLHLAFFSSANCRLCRGLLKPARRLGASVFDERDDRQAWTDAAVPGAPYAVVLAADGAVLAKGTVNTRRQLVSVLATGRERSGQAAPAPPAGSRRRFLATAGAAVGAIAAARTVASLIDPAEADAYHICGHTYTTDSCPHPTGLPRIDNAGYPLRPRDGHRIDDLGRPVDRRGAPVNRAGRPLLDPDGRPLPSTSRTRVCSAAGKRFGIATRTDGSWSRCCDGHVRRLSDCCSSSSRRINGDGGLQGYCYGGRTVFCVVYHQTRIPC
ncbi:MAG TPA: MauE/DoxX family redox-associated membrane protein [Solirubrobacteraceae bacterium]|nr:MauE/DoxX family redox-associated membrane protein [Solirubrobacteraceae bacterium]